MLNIFLLANPTGITYQTWCSARFSSLCIKLYWKEFTKNSLLFSIVAHAVVRDMSVSVVIVFVTQECQDDKDRLVFTLCVIAKTIFTTTILTAALFALCIVTRVFAKD